VRRRLGVVARRTVGVVSNDKDEGEAVACDADERSGRGVASRQNPASSIRLEI
jgi:hypothetical protein